MNTLFVSSRFRAAFAVLLLFVVSSLFAQQQEKSPFTLKVRAERESAIYKKGETVPFRVSLLEDDKPLVGKTLSYVVQGDGHFEKKGTITSTAPFTIIEAALDHPGALKCVVTWNESPNNKVTSLGGAVIDPHEICSAIPEPNDFDAFWNRKKKELADMPMNPKLTPVPKEKVNNDKVEVFDIRVDCPGGAPVSGYFAKPVDAAPKSLPIVVSYHGAGVRSSNMPTWIAARGALALDINAHGIENGHPDQFYKDLSEGALKDYRNVGNNDLEKNYFVGMYQRVLRALQFMKAQPEWDGKTVVVTGGSQGGGQALVAAGLDPDVTFCVAYVPALCYHVGDLEGNFGGWPGFLRGKTKETADADIMKTVPYIDAALFAKRIKAESVLSTGFIDYVCSPTSVFVAYNNIPGKKQIFPTPETDHSTPKSTNDAAGQLLWKHIEDNKK
ncbi:MAG: acetylxylan esterase [Thermoguttaceae bacterium]